MDVAKKDTTSYKVMSLVIKAVLLGILALALYLIVTNIKSILLLVIALIGIILIGAVVIKIAYFLFSILLLLTGIVAFLSLTGWVIHWFG
ncbi:hypothetical protein GLW04_19475 [Halobacillus litoralis]|uniref:Uncharacterized protein n=1 Tax=Halobacillus litoralis TaxID=45668 RepID=A0A845DZ11_9BACI|nr:hypothetical protein [Halobacillus litoralis]MYL22059.1 hypothetical protein [Halobacillus litoralis]